MRAFQGVPVYKAPKHDDFYEIIVIVPVHVISYCGEQSFSEHRDSY